jgi:predicted small metal-binding protein
MEEDMAMTYSYACKEFPGMETCPAHFHAETEGELWKIIELHASLAHGEDASAWPAEDIAQLKALIKTD